MPGDYYQNVDEGLNPQLETLLERAVYSEVEAFPLVASVQLGGGDYYQNDVETKPPSFYFGDEVDAQLNTFDQPFEPTRQNRAIKSFLNRAMPTGPRSHGKLMGWHRKTAQGKETPLAPAYELEKQDPRHRMGFVLADFMRYHESHSIPKPFFAWLDGLSYFEVVKILKHDLGKTDAYIRQFARPFMRGVAYLNEASRKTYRVKVDKASGKLSWRGAPFDTEKSKLQTVFSGIGWGIWVLSPKDKFYSGPHVKGEFHHSSFLSGEPVKAAGEWKVRDGVVESVTGKTGHYMCDCEDLVYALRTLTGKGVSLAKAKVIIWEATGERKPREVPALSFMIDKKLQQDYAAFGSAPLNKPVRPEPRGSFMGAHRAKA